MEKKIYPITGETEQIDRIPLGMYGFYTDDPKVFEQLGGRDGG